MPITSGMGRSPLTSEAVLNTQPNAKFVLAVHPSSAAPISDGLEKTTWLPQPNKLPLEAGVLGVRLLKRGEPEHRAWAEMAQRMESDEIGFTIIPADLPVSGEFCSDGKDRDSYLVGSPCRNLRNGIEGTYWHTPWDLRRETRSTRDPAQWDFDHENFNRWLLHLIETGVIPAPDQWARQDRIADARRAADKRRNIADPAIRAEAVKAAEAKVAAAEGAVVPSVVEPEPKRRGRSKGAA